MIGSSVSAEEAEFKTVFEDNKKRPLDKRKREKNTDASDIEGELYYLFTVMKIKETEMSNDK